MSILLLLANLLGFVGFAAYVWMVVLAFKESAAWGFGVLLLPPVLPIIFAIKHWEIAKRPFWIHAGSMTLSLAITLYVFFYVTAPMIAMGSQLAQNGDMDPDQAKAFMSQTLDRVENSGMVDVQDQTELQRMRDTLRDFDVKDGGVPAPTVASGQGQDVVMLALQARPAGTADPEPLVVARYTPQKIDPSRAGDHVGEMVRVEDRDGYVIKGKLVSSRGGRIVVEKHIGSGTFGVELRTTDIQSMRTFDAMR